MSVKTFHILDTAFFPPFPKEFHPCRWLYNLQTWINISKFAYLVVGSFLTVKALPLFWLWGVLKHLQFSMSSGNGPLSKPPKPSCSVRPSPPAIHAAPLGLFGTWPHHTVTMLCWPYVLSICQVSPFFSVHTDTLLVVAASESGFLPPVSPRPPPYLLYTRRNFYKRVSDYIPAWVEPCDDFPPPLW